MRRVDTTKPDRENQQRGDNDREAEPLDGPPTRMQQMERRRGDRKVDLIHPKPGPRHPGEGRRALVRC
jgi:hypothetical protein